MSRPTVSDMREALDYIDHLEKTVKWKDETIMEIYRELIELKNSYEGKLVSIETAFVDPEELGEEFVTEYKKDLACYCSSVTSGDVCYCNVR